MGEELADTLGHLNEAADSVKRLAEFLERNPNALITGTPLVLPISARRNGHT